MRQDRQLGLTRIRSAPDGGLHGRDAAGNRRAHDVGAASLDLGDALLGVGDQVAQRLESGFA